MIVATGTLKPGYLTQHHSHTHMLTGTRREKQRWAAILEPVGADFTSNTHGVVEFGARTTLALPCLGFREHLVYLSRAVS